MLVFNMKKIPRIFSVIALSLLVALITSCAESDKHSEQVASPGHLESVLIFSKTTGWRHDSISEGIEAVKRLLQQRGLTAVATEDANLFTDEHLREMAAVVFLNTTGDVLDEKQQQAFERYIQAGGGFVGVHAATDTEHEGDWYWYRRLVGGVFESHPNDPSNVQRARVQVVESNHLATRDLPAEFYIADEWYDFRSLSDRRHDLLTVDERTYQGGQHGAYHPIAWYQDFDGGRVFYTGLGHTRQTYSNQWFLKHLDGGLEYALAR